MTLPHSVSPAENEGFERHEWSSVYASSNEAYKKLQTLRCPQVPARNPHGAFLGWVKRFTKGKDAA
ncbi:MAG: hypothetical protein ACLPSW_27415 [Roseiarcus sp.]